MSKWTTDREPSGKRHMTKPLRSISTEDRMGVCDDLVRKMVEDYVCRLMDTVQEFGGDTNDVFYMALQYNRASLMSVIASLAATIPMDRVHLELLEKNVDEQGERARRLTSRAVANRGPLTLDQIREFGALHPLEGR